MYLLRRLQMDTVKSKGKISQNFAAFSEYMNFKNDRNISSGYSTIACALLSKEHTLYLSFLGPNNQPLSSPKFESCL